MKLVCISDTHGQHAKLTIPSGDVLIHAGDLSGRGKPAEIADFNAWLGTLPHPHKVVIAGNHDFLFEQEPVQARQLLNNACYLEDSAVALNGLRFWGSPITPWFFNWAFNRHRGPDIARYWDLIPEGIDVLITHGPPHGIMDRVAFGRHVGCEELKKAIDRVKPKVVIFGHIHEGYGQLKTDGVHYINASSLDQRYRPVNAPIVVDIP